MATLRASCYSPSAVGGGRRVGAWLAALLFALLGARGEELRAAVPYSEDQVKAVFLYRFAGYVEWPTPLAAGARFHIAVLDADGVAAELEQLLPDHPIHGRPATVRRVHTAREAADAQMLYIGGGYAGDLARTIAPLANQPMLIISDRHNGLNAGSTLNFVSVDQHVRFEVSAMAARRAGLRISSDLLAVASRVRGASTGVMP